MTRFPQYARREDRISPVQDGPRAARRGGFREDDRLEIDALVAFLHNAGLARSRASAEMTRWRWMTRDLRRALARNETHSKFDARWYI